MQAATARGGKGDRTLLAVALCAFLPLVALAVFAVLEAARSYHAADDARRRGTARAIAAAVDAQLAGHGLGAIPAACAAGAAGPAVRRLRRHRRWQPADRRHLRLE